LLEYNAVIDSQTDEGTSALMIASANGNTQIVQLLLEKGANTSLRNKYGKSAIDVASSGEIRKLLLN
jgi:ankyrin repeat protein